MFTGWIHHWHKVNRPLFEQETAGRLDPKLRSPVLPDERANRLRMNSVFAEFIDSRYYRRGVPTLVGGVGALFFVAAAIYMMVPFLKRWWTIGPGVADTLVALFIQVLLLSLAIACWKLTVMKDLFTYTYYPIRFNRKTRNVHVFRHNGEGGVLTVPWDKAFFFIGQGQGGEKHVFELRCHVLDDHGMVIDTFAVGHDERSRGGVLELWEMIRLYMEEGPQTLPSYPVFPFPNKVSWKESWTAIATQLGGADIVMMIATSPMWAVGTVAHYLTLKTCKAPVWPPDIEQACRFEPDDPYLLPEERYEDSHPRSKEIWDAVGVQRARNLEVLRAWEREQRSARWLR